jgi:tetratricopeptide (TPR) repeat protein
MTSPKKKASERSLSEPEVGYKRPPVGRQFRKGQSGNRRGRPKGISNIATLTKALLNEPVAVRENGNVRRMPSGEAVFRSQIARAGGGDPKSLFAVMDIIEMTGGTNEVSDEEREKRSLHLSNPMPIEQMDLLWMDTREKERERCRKIVECHPERYATSTEGVPAVVVPPDIQAGDRLAGAGEFDDALACYRQEITLSKRELTADTSNETALERFRRAVARIGLLADSLLFAGEFSRAAVMADEALRLATPPCWIPKKLAFGNFYSSTAWIDAVRAHAWMLSGRVEEARKFYFQFNSNKRIAMTSWETSILRDHVCLRKAGHSHPLMDEIEKRYADAGWTTGRINTKAFAPEMKGEDSVYIQQNPETIKAGDLLRDFGKLDEALVAYFAYLKKWKANLAKDTERADWKQNVSEAVDRVTLTIMEQFKRGRLNTAYEAAEQACIIAPDELPFQAVRASALMMRGHNRDARTLFLEHRGKTTDGKSWEAFVTTQFAVLRKAGCGRPLMDEIEKRFAGINVPETPDATTRKAADARATLVQASDVHAADLLAREGMLDEALVVYSRCLDDCCARIKGGRLNNRTIDDRNGALNGILAIGGDFLMSGQFEKALSAAELAISSGPNITLKHRLYKAHALMLLNRGEEAEHEYLGCRGETDGVDSGESLILEDFAALRRHELSHPLMIKLENLFRAEANGSEPASSAIEGI